jgi:hypothetical protein
VEVRLLPARSRLWLLSPLRQCCCTPLPVGCCNLQLPLRLLLLLGRAALRTLASAFSTSQILTDGSLAADAMTLLAVGCHCSSDTGLPWPLSVTSASRMGSVRPPSGIDQILTVVSSLAVASMLSLNGFHAVSYTAAEWPLMVG